MPELFVTNFNKNFTGVSATAANVIRQQAKHHDLHLVGYPLPGCPDPITLKQARLLSKRPPAGRDFAIWHVRRNPEMRAAIWSRDVLRLPIRIVFTSAAQRLHSSYPRWLIRQMDAIVATTDIAARYVSKVRAVVPHGVDTDLFTPAQDRAASWAKLGYGGDLGLATIGRIRPEKGTDVFVDAMIQLLPKLPDARGLVIGRAGREHQKFLTDLQTRVAAAKLSDRILFPGEIAATALPHLMRGLSLVMQLPRYEGYGMVPLEGMASMVPFVGSPAGYYEEFSALGKTGTIVPFGAADQAAAAALSILTVPNRHASMSNAGRETAVNRFSAVSEAVGIENVYRELWNEQP